MVWWFLEKHQWCSMIRGNRIKKSLNLFHHQPTKSFYFAELHQFIWFSTGRKQNEKWQFSNHLFTSQLKSITFFPTSAHHISVIKLLFHNTHCINRSMHANYNLSCQQWLKSVSWYQLFHSSRGIYPTLKTFPLCYPSSSLYK